MSGKTFVGGYIPPAFGWGATTFYLSYCGFYNDGESEAIAKLSSAHGTYSNLSMNVKSNNGTITAKHRSAGANGNQIASSGASGTGWFTDVTNTDVQADGDKIAIQIASTGGTTLLCGAWSEFDAADGSMTFYGGRGATSSGNNGGGYYSGLAGGSPDGTEAGAQVKMTTGGTLSHLTCYEINGFQTFKSRINGADGNLSVLGAASTWTEDSTHSDAFSAGDLICYHTAATSTERTYHEGMRFVTSGAGCQEMQAATTASGSINTPSYFNFIGDAGNGSLEADQQLKFPFQIKSQSFRVYQYATGTGPITGHMRVNGASVNGTVSISTGTTGLVTDVTNTDTINSGDKACALLSIGSGAANIGWVGISLVPGSSTETSTAVMSFSGISFTARASDSLMQGVEAFSGIAFAGIAHDVTGQGIESFSGVSYAGDTVRRETSDGALAYAGIAYGGATSRVETSTGALVFKGISYTGRSSRMETSTGVLALGHSFAITALGFDLPAAGDRSFWTFGA